jgi:cellobiose-specific phosphotransferase system component IIB
MHSSEVISQQLISRNFDQQCQLFDEQRKLVKTSRDFIEHTIEANTKEEVNHVQHAVDRLNRKVDAILKTPQIKAQVERVEVVEKNMQITVKLAIKMFEVGKKSIVARIDLTPEQKHTYISSLHDKLLKKLYSPEEIQRFQNMFRNAIVSVQDRPDNFRNTKALSSGQDVGYLG